jgi:ABC-type sugar transport system substrate-binding protein
MQAVQQADLTCTVMVPSEDHSVDQQRVLLRTLLTDGGEYLGGVVVCSGWPDKLFSELLELAQQLSMPVVLVDRNPPIGASRVPPMLSYVSVNDEEGGRLAGEAVVRLAEQQPVKRILVIAGYAKRGRSKAFQEKIMTSEALRGCEVTITEDGRFDRWVAENLTYNFLDDSVQGGKPFDVIFCVADSMTVGCLDAIARFAGRTTMPMPKVIGYDGTSTTRTLVENRRSPLVKIVVQDSKEIARTAIAKLLELSQRERSKPAKPDKKSRKTAKTNNIVWVEPYLFPRVERTG